MPYFGTSQEWLEQSSLLIKARPTTTRVTAKWTLPKLRSSTSPSKRQKRKADKASNASAVDNTSASEAPTASSVPPSAELTLKTYDPASGVTLKYRTDQAAEVGRLVAVMGRLGRSMAASPDEEIKDEAAAAEGAVGEQGTGRNTPVPKAVSGETKGGAGQGGGGQGGGKKKKKGRK
ncbi:hypothetical protein EV356DRAFT_528930 [Viridothelium virens]|uniref:SRP9 domain-containing protein n=1 Tax=Viridothelium virens TaxID=1048519 RepID=A0A6A6HNK6_VIRVR|nr:hypothetical protein EV356DRAFT_528930 [Viridothelium virens]